MAVEVSNAGELYSNSSVVYDVVEDAIVERLVPSGGSVAGLGVVKVIGQHFMQTGKLVCRFGALAMTAARLISSSVVLCAAPAGEAGTVSVEMSHDGHSFTESGVQ